jgi:sporulation protein YlmC with PRC-barrel domain
VPWLETNPEHIVLDVANFDISEVLELSVYSGSGKALGKVVCSQANLPHVKIADAMIRISWRGKGARGQGEVSVVPISLVQKEQELFDHTANPGGQDNLFTQVASDLLVGLQWWPFVEIVAGVWNLDHLASLNAIGEILQGLFTQKAVVGRIRIEYHFKKDELLLGKTSDPGIIAGYFYGVVEA